MANLLREAARRIALAILLPLGVLAIVAFMPFVILFGRRTYADEVGSAASCLLCAATGGPRVATFSAWSWELFRRGKPGAAERVRAVDAVNFQRDHSRKSWVSHVNRGYLPGD